VGTVILAAWDKFPEEAALRTMLSGKGAKLESQFRLTYGRGLHSSTILLNVSHLCH
jgi:superfamily II RNA helicase